MVLNGSFLDDSRYPAWFAWYVPLLLFRALADVVFLVALLRLKRWALWGYTCTSIVQTSMNYFVMNNIMYSICYGMPDLVILGAIIFIGRKSSLWNRMD